MPTDIVLGPWYADKAIEEAQRKALTAAMGDEAWKVVKKAPEFVPVAKDPAKDRDPGYSISGRIKRVVKSPKGTEVVATFSVYLDGYLTTAPMVEGTATASGSYGAEDALRAIVEGRVRALLNVIKAGSVKRQG